MSLFLNSAKTATAGMLFMVPHREAPWSARKLAKRFPHIVDHFDGRTQDSQLLFYYKYNSAEKVFEFIDPDAEEDFADLLGVKVATFAEVDEDAAPENAPLSKEQLELHHENIRMIRDGLVTMKTA